MQAYRVGKLTKSGCDQAPFPLARTRREILVASRVSRGDCQGPPCCLSGFSIKNGAWSRELAGAISSAGV